MYYSSPEEIFITSEKKKNGLGFKTLDYALDPKTLGESQMETKVMQHYCIICYRLFQLSLWSQGNKAASSPFASSKSRNMNFKK